MRGVSSRGCSTASAASRTRRAARSASTSLSAPAWPRSKRVRTPSRGGSARTTRATPPSAPGARAWRRRDGGFMSERRPRLLIIDDDADIRDVVVLLFEDRGYDVDAIADGIDAVQLAKDYDVIL